MSWGDNARSIIAEIHASLPADADLKARRAALRAGRPRWFTGTSWGRKVWAACARQYLQKHGQDPGRGKRKAEAPLFDQVPMSPLERQKFIAESPSLSRTQQRKIIKEGRP